MRFQLNATDNIITEKEMSNKAKETFLFISSVFLKPNSKVHHYNMSELVVKLKLKFTTWITVPFPTFYISCQIGLIQWVTTPEFNKNASQLH